jgi:DNA-binding NarL/FixJ family response regulator
MTPSDGPIRVLIVDDHVIVREGLREILDSQEGIVVVGDVGDSGGAVALAAEKRPDVVILDIQIPGDDVTVTVNRIREITPDTKIIILSMYEGPRLLQKLLAAGVRGYLVKSVHRDDLVSAVRSVSAEDGRVVLKVSAASLAHAVGPSAGVLSERERDVLELTARALSNAQIASRLNLTEATVKRHLRNIFVKLGAVSRIDAVNKAVAASLISGTERDPLPGDIPHRGH